MDVAAGQLVASPYRLVDRVCAGGMGVVYRATDEHLRRTVALKFLPTGSQQDADRLGRFRNEARALAALNHPHIVSVYEGGQDGDAPFFVMELVEGETLRSRLRRGPLAAADALDVAQQVARGLAAAHEKGLIHRDIKRENVMIRRDGYVKILDFGIALLRASSAATTALTPGSLETVAGGVIGTPAYMVRANRRRPCRLADGRLRARSALVRGDHRPKSVQAAGRQRHRHRHPRDARAAADKKHVVFDTPHDVRLRRPDLVREVLAWLDKNLGPVQ